MSSLPRPDEETQVLAGEYVLGLLCEDQHQAVEQELATNPVLGEAVAFWTRQWLPLTRLAAPVPVPSALWSQIEQSLERPSAVPAAPAVPLRGPVPAAPARRATRRRTWTALAAAAMLLLAVGLATLLPLRSTVPTVVAVAVLNAPDGTPGWLVEAYADRTLKLRPLAATHTEVAAGSTLQFWTKRNNVEGPVSLGLMTPQGADRVPLKTLPEPVDGQVFELTLEPAGGSTVGHPTGPVLYKGLAARTS